MSEDMLKPEVSIIMANYNCEKWILETIRCVQNQTFQNWELLITDDCSKDNSVDIIKREQENDKRIKLFIFEDNQGAGRARNNSLKHANGRYIAYLDSDDLWTKEKLERQLKFMKENKLVMCYTDYDLVNEEGEYRKTIHVPASVTYDGYLKRPITCTHSIMFDTNRVDKKLLLMPDIRRGQDGATWLKVLKTGIKGYALSESLAKYRRHEGSLSNNKFKAVKRMWYLYRKVEHLSFPYSCACFVSYAINAIKKYF